jgi:hypothetical protein
MIVMAVIAWPVIMVIVPPIMTIIMPPIIGTIIMAAIIIIVGFFDARRSEGGILDRPEVRRSLDQT